MKRFITCEIFNKKSLTNTPHNRLKPTSSKALAFTLAEVLITLAIIGVVAAMTIPNLMANNAKTEQVVALKSVYSDISQALKLMMVDEGVSKVSDTNILTWDWVEDYTVVQQRAGEQFLKKYFKYVKLSLCVIKNPKYCEINLILLYVGCSFY